MRNITSREDINHPRGGTGWSDVPAATQSAAHSFMGQMHAENAPAIDLKLSADINALKTTLEGKKGPSAARQTHIESLEGAREGLARMPSDPMEAAVGRVTETASMSVSAARDYGKQNKTLVPVYPGEFYGNRHEAGKAIAEHEFPKDPDRQLRAQLATPPLSAMTGPTQELAGGSGLMHMLNPKHGGRTVITIRGEAADFLNSPEKSKENPNAIGIHGGHGGRVPIKPGEYSFSELSEKHPNAAALILQHHVKGKGIVTPQKSKYTPERLEVTQRRSGILAAHTRLELPEDLYGAAGETVSGFGTGGFPKGATAMKVYYGGAGAYGDSETHKIPSYTWNIMNADSVMKAGTHHFLGVLAHGKKWLDQHPEGHAALAAVKSHPAWHDPTSTIDVWSGKVASGIPYHAVPHLEMFGKKRDVRPEDLMIGGMPKREGGSRYGSPKDMGYFWGEEAHRLASKNFSINVPGVGRMNAPPHVVQSLSWYGVQAEDNPHSVKTGKRSLVPTSLGDPRSLNVMQFPQLH
jgi:hypothetical protein